MLKQTINYTDFNGVERTEDLYFNLTEFELVDIQTSSERGIQAEMEDAVKANDLRRLLDFIKMLIHKSYGVKSADGRHFEKSPEILNHFVNSAYYSDLLLNLFQDEGARAIQFITGLMPKDLIERAAAKSQGQTGVPSTYAPSARERNAQFVAGQNIPQPTFEEAPPIGKTGDLQFQAPPAFPTTRPPHESQAAPAQPVQSPPSVQDAPPVPASSQPFRVKETPLDEIAGKDLNNEDTTDIHAVASDEDRAAFEAWKAQQRGQQES